MGKAASALDGWTGICPAELLIDTRDEENNAADDDGEVHFQNPPLISSTTDLLQSTIQCSADLFLATRVSTA